VEDWDSDMRIGVVASGGLTHFTVDEELDRMVLDAVLSHDGDSLSEIPMNRLGAGSSEILNWIVMAGASEHLDPAWSSYEPMYRSLAGTGCGMGFAVFGEAA